MVQCHLYTRRDEDELLGKEDDPTAGIQKRVPSIPQIDEGDIYTYIDINEHTWNIYINIYPCININTNT